MATPAGSGDEVKAVESGSEPVAGDPDPARWVDEHGDVLFRYALMHLRDKQRAEDAVQETLLAALSARVRYEGRAGERTWLVGILKHKIADDFRQRSREETLEEDADVDALFERNGHWRHGPKGWRRPDSACEDQAFVAVLARCLDGLPERQARAFLLAEVDGESASAACNVLGVTATNFWVLMHRARLRLRACLEANWFGRGRTRA